MDPEWIKSPTARRVLVHWADARPAWLWTRDGDRSLWRNEAARFFQGKIKKRGLKLAPEPVPIRGQVARLIRLGSVGRSSLSRIRFLAGERPVSTTCTCTPLELPDGRLALLIVGVDPIEPELLDLPDPRDTDPAALSLFPSGSDYLAISDDSQIISGSHRALERYAPIIESEGLPDLPPTESGEVEIAGDHVLLTRYRANQHDALLLLFEATGGQVTAQQAAEKAARDDAAIDAEPLLPLGLTAIARTEPPATDDDDWTESMPDDGIEPVESLSSLFDRLAGDESLFTPLTAADDKFRSPAGDAKPAKAEVPVSPRDDIADLIHAADDESRSDDEAAVAEAAVEPPRDTGQKPVLWRVVARRIVPRAVTPIPEGEDAVQPAAPAPQEQPAESASPTDEAPPTLVEIAPRPALPDRDAVERVSRYNFDELSRILIDRVSAEPASQRAAATAAPETAPRPGGGDGGQVNVAGETFILNRLPLGILVFRDGQVLFANRALIDLTGYDSIENLRSAGLSAIFPAVDTALSGPVTHLVNRDGGLLPVNARLQSIAWQGKPAVMLTASAVESRPANEFAVRSFAELAAGMRDEGFVAADRAGVVTHLSLHGRVVLGREETALVGSPLSTLIDPQGTAALRAFLARPARFAETTRPGIVLAGSVPGTELTLFAEGQAGIVSGYFGFVRKASTSAAPGATPRPSRGDDIEPSMLVRISRGIRRPLNTIIGFADMIRSSAFGPLENQRYVEYARDIGTAGTEIALLVDEIDDYARLRDGQYAARTDEIDLSALLDTSVLRCMGQAASRRVLVRSAISERLPRIKADGASLTQAILNLLASAIDQTPAGSTVILSAQFGDDGSVVVNVRDSAEARGDLGERFVVFRDGVGRDGEELQPVRSSVGLALTRSLLAVNALSLSVDPTAGVGTIFSLVIPGDLVVKD